MADADVDGQHINTLLLTFLVPLHAGRWSRPATSTSSRPAAVQDQVERPGRLRVRVLRPRARRADRAGPAERQADPGGLHPALQGSRRDERRGAARSPRWTMEPPGARPGHAGRRRARRRPVLGADGRGRRGAARRSSSATPRTSASWTSESVYQRPHLRRTFDQQWPTRTLLCRRPAEDVDAPWAMRVEPVGLETEMQRSYLDYAMSVIVVACAARRPRRPQARAPPGAVRDVRRRLPAPRRASTSAPASSATSWARTTRTATARSTTRWSRLAQPWSMRMPLVDSNGNFGSPGNDPAAAMRYTECQDGAAVAWRWSGTSTRRPSTSRTTTTAAPRSRRSCRRASRTCWSTARRASRRHGDQHPAAQPARGRGRRAVVPGATRRPRARSCSDALIERIKGPTSRPARWSSAARASRRRTAPAAARSPMRAVVAGRGDPEPAQCLVVTEAARTRPTRTTSREDRRPGQGRQGRRHRRRPRRRPPPHRPAPGDRAQARRGRQGRAQQPVQAHRPAGRTSAPTCWPWSTACRAPCRLDRVHPALGGPPDRGHRPRGPRFRLRKAEERAHILRGSAQGAGRARRGHRADPALADGRDRARGPDGACWRSTRSRPNAILEMQLRRLAALERQKIIDEHDEARGEDRRATRTILGARPSGSGRSSARNWPRSSSKYGDDRRSRCWSRSTATCPSRT